MDISTTNVLKGVGQYFQGLPTGSRANAPPHTTENDGSVRSEQHSAVPVYWDQQNEGQAAAAMSQPQRPQSRPLAGGMYGAHGTHSSHITPGLGPGAGTGSKTYYELQTKSKASSLANHNQGKPDATRGYYPAGGPPVTGVPGGSFYTPSSSSSQDGYYKYAQSSRLGQGHAPTGQYSSYYPPASQSHSGPAQPQAQPHPQPPHQHPSSISASRRHLPVQPSNVYHHTSSRHLGNTSVGNSGSGSLLKVSKASTNPPSSYNVNSANTKSYNGLAVGDRGAAQGSSYGYYPNGNYPPSNITNNNNYTTTSGVSRASYANVNTPHPPSVTNYPPRPLKPPGRNQAQEYAPAPSPRMSLPVPAPPVQGPGSGVAAASAVGVQVPVPKVKRESPLDLSVKTVRTSADSTLDDDVRLQGHQGYRPARFDLTHHQQYVARAPKVDFSPNFAMQDVNKRQAPGQGHAHGNPPGQQHNVQMVAGRSNYYNYPYATSTLPKVEFDFQQRKRSLEQQPPVVPEKVPKLAKEKVDVWRQKMDQQIEQRFSSYTNNKHQGAPSGTGVPAPSGVPQEVGLTNGGQSQGPPQPQHPYYYNMKVPSGGKEAAPSSAKPPATKKVLNLLRTSLQNKGMHTHSVGHGINHGPNPTANHKLQSPKKERLEPTRSSYLDREVLQPSTDVMAPLQPKPGIVGRRNVSPFTAASLDRNSNTPPTYKFHIPKAIDSVIISDEGEKDQEASMGGGDLDGLAAFLAARIRTKAELKQVTSNDASAGGAPGNNNGERGTSGTPPKLKKEPPGSPNPSPAIPKKLFGRNEMKRSEVRSSSETSVFDFPDSDNEEMPVLERQSLLNMRKDRKVVVGGVAAKNVDGQEQEPDGEKIEEDRASSPFSLLFNQTCDSFVEQLKGGTGKKRGRRKRPEEMMTDKVPHVAIEDIKKEKEDDIEDVPVVIKQEPLEVESVEVPKDNEPKDVALSSAKPSEDTQDEDNDKQNHTDTDSDTPLVHIATKQRKKFTKKECRKEEKSPKKNNQLDKESVKDKEVSSDSEVEKFSRRTTPQKDFYDSLKSITICKPGKKPTFGDGSDFRPGWEDALYRYKKSIRIPMQLIQVTRPPSSQRLSTSLPDLDPCPCSPALKTESIDSDMDSSNCSFSFSKHYDSDQGSMKSFSSKCSILDKLLVRVGAKKKRKFKKEDSLGPKIIPKSENELLPTPSLEIKDVIVKSTSALLGFRKKTVDSFKDAFINNSNKIVGVNEFNTVVLKARTRTETRVLKEKATIREVFGEDRPASAPPVTCVDELKPEATKDKENQNQLKKEFSDVLIKAIESKKLEITVDNIKKEKDDKDAKDDDSITVISNDSMETGETIGRERRRNKLRRKLSSGFDYIRKKKKQIKKEDGEDAQKAKRRGAPTKATPESVDDIQKEVKQWVLNKGVGETHLHRASRAGYTDITAYCLEKMMCNPSPKDNAGYTPLHEACSRGHLDIARLLLEYGAQVSESGHGGIRPLHEAAENGYVEIIRLLLSYGADPSLATYSGTTPLQLASDDQTIAVLQEHLDELHGKSQSPWKFGGPASIFDDNEGFDPLADVPTPDPQSETEDFDFEVSEHLLPNLYILPDCEASDRWMILQDLSNALKIKSKETLLRQLNISSPAKSDLVREMKMQEFLEKAHCCQFMHANEKLNTRLSKIFLVKYTDKVKRLLNVEDWKFASAATNAR